MSIDLNQLKQQKRSVDPTFKKSTNAAQSGSWMDFLNRDIQLFGGGLSWQHKEALFSELAVLLRAGLDIRSALELIQANEPKEKIRNVFASVYQTLVDGASLAAAMEQTQQFSTYELSSIRIAEESGKLLPVLERLATHFAKNIQLRRLLMSALSYPILVLVVAGFSLLFLLNFLVPLFGDIYARLNQELPGITQFIINFSDQLNKSLPYLTVGTVVLGIVGFYFRKADLVKQSGAALMIRLPLFGPLIRKVYLSRFNHGLSFLLSSSVPLTQALELVGTMVDFHPISSKLINVQQQILHGQALHESLQKVTIVPARMLALIKIGEETNHLPQMLEKIAAQYDEEVEQKTKLLGSLLEPLLIVFLAITVGIVLVSMYLPIFKLVTNFGL
ncbi:MAG: type II secretion system F family protein [Lewinella sp.]|uniref:type II secretion system F family protein n=1 Tax=Lewinella sp. TaxID=2004506 RepID=UPI003D6C1BFC